MNQCEVVVINFKRPANLPVIAEAFRAQTVPVTLTLCDAHSSEEFALGADCLAKFDKVYRWTHNFGAFNRYIPSFGIRAEYVYFHDDDMAPGPRAIENLIHYAEQIGEFGVLGQFGRRFADGRISQEGVFAQCDPIPVDSLVRGYFVKTRNLAHLFQKIASLRFNPEYLRHDDLLLSMTMRAAGLVNYAIPTPEPDKKLNARELPADFALHKADPADHRTTRQNVLSKVFFDSAPEPAPLPHTGLLYLSIGDRRKYLNGALASANRFTKLPVHVVSNLPYPAGMTLVSATEHNRWYKTSLLFQSPFAITLLLDDDTRFERPISASLLNEALGDADIAMARDHYLPTVGAAIEYFLRPPAINREECEYVRKLGFDPDEPYFNSGVIIARKTKAVTELFLTWFQEWNRFRGIDQFALFRALERTRIRVTELDLNFNTPGAVPNRDACIRHFYGRYENGKLAALQMYDEQWVDPTRRTGVAGDPAAPKWDLQSPSNRR